MRWTDRQRPEMPDSTAVLIYCLPLLSLLLYRQSVQCVGVKADSEGYIQPLPSAQYLVLPRQPYSSLYCPFFGQVESSYHIFSITYNIQ